ncbi:hypothetical protein [Streptomyces angustmyceticus]|uniref:hypothetical protein n=1 Tax=Streptomyces angustmyceticus TaxID=285578 RepID=UPI00380BFB9E
MHHRLQELQDLTGDQPGSRIQDILDPASVIAIETKGKVMWSGKHDSYFEATGRAIDEQMQRNRARKRAAAVKYSREQLEQSRKISHASEAAELERLAVLGQIPMAEYKARMAALDEEADIETSQ